MNDEQVESDAEALRVIRLMDEAHLTAPAGRLP